MNVTCVLCGCREGRWRILKLPGLTAHFSACGIRRHHSQPVLFSFSSLGAELSWAVNPREHPLAGEQGLVGAEEGFPGDSCRGLGVGVTKSQFWNVCRQIQNCPREEGILRVC